MAGETRQSPRHHLIPSHPPPPRHARLQQLRVLWADGRGGHVRCRMPPSARAAAPVPDSVRCRAERRAGGSLGGSPCAGRIPSCGASPLPGSPLRAPRL
ncbi:hypothetical protein T492DRAFT_919121, partial [Pavlovales sp. CCMP2436]